MKVLIACEFSGIVRDAFIERGHDAISCDLLDSERPGPHHKGDVLQLLARERFDLMIAHPPCTRLANSGVRWLKSPPAGKTVALMWTELESAANFYLELRAAPVPLKALENPVMHLYARRLIGETKRHIVQPHFFGDPFFKATGFELIGLPPLHRTHNMLKPLAGSAEHKQWSAVHRAPPGPDRWKDRSRTFPGLARAMAEQWGAL